MGSWMGSALEVPEDRCTEEVLKVLKTCGFKDDRICQEIGDGCDGVRAPGEVHSFKFPSKYDNDVDWSNLKGGDENLLNTVEVEYVDPKAGTNRGIFLNRDYDMVDLAENRGEDLIDLMSAINIICPGTFLRYVNEEGNNTTDYYTRNVAIYMPEEQSIRYVELLNDAEEGIYPDSRRGKEVEVVPYSIPYKNHYITKLLTFALGKERAGELLENVEEREDKK